MILTPDLIDRQKGACGGVDRLRPPGSVIFSRHTRNMTTFDLPIVGQPASEPTLQARRTFLLQSAAAATACSTTLSPAVGWGSAPTRPDVPTQGPAAFQDKGKTFDSSLKQQARWDYHRSFQAWGGRLSTPIERLFAAASSGQRPAFDFLIIGSGYGAAITAARLASQAHDPTRIGMLERGREWVPGTFPDRFADLTAQTREVTFGPKQRTLQNPLGLFDVRVNDEVDVMVGSGLGGTSLINASISLRPSPDVFHQPEWPTALQDIAELEPYYDLADLVLDVESRPGCLTRKSLAQQSVAERLGYPHERAALTVIMQRRMLDAQFRNPHGIYQRPCTYCGDCITGCNVGAKGTLTTSYLPLAKRHGVQMFSQTEVRYLEPCSEGWRVHFTHWIDDGQAVRPEHGCVSAANVILGAGSLGSTEILLRSQRSGLALSPRLGCRWSTNGDGLGFLRQASTCPNAVGVGAYVTDHPPVGPTVETTSYVNLDGPLEERLLIQEGAIPRGVANFFGLLFGNPDLDNTLALLAVGHDSASGRIRLIDNRATVVWPGVQQSAHRERIQQTIARFADAHGARYRVVRAFGDRLATVHPLGGCNMGDSSDHGVVNHLGQVFAPHACETSDVDQDGQRVHRGLYVADGSIVPRSLGANPYMTICALSERIAFHLPLQPALKSLLRPWN